MLKKYAFIILCVFSSLQTFAQVNYTANDQVTPYEGTFRPGINFGDYPNYSDEELAEMAAGNLAKNIKGVGVKAARPGLFESFTSIYGIDSRVNTYQYYEELGMKENTVIVGFPSDASTDPTYYCSNVQSTLFKDMYLDIWDDGANGTPVNDDNIYAKYVYELVTTYKDYVRFWEIWNEPGFDYTGALGPLPPGAAGNWWDNNPDPCDYKLRAPIMHYVRMLRISYEVIKTVDPEAYVVVSGTGYPSFLDAILRNTDNPDDGSPTADFPLGGGAYFDVMGYHFYPHFDGSLRSWDDVTQSWQYNRHSDAAADGLKAAKDTMQVVLSSYGYDGINHPAKNWIITESNLPRKAFKDFIGSNEAQKNFITKSYVACVKNDIAQMHYYKISEDTDYDGAYYEFNTMGLYEKLNNQKPEFQIATDEGIALGTATALLFGKTFDENRLAQLNLPQGVKGAAFKDEDGNYTYVLWAETTIDQSEAASANFSFPSSFGFSDILLFDWDYSKTNTVITSSSSNIPLSATPIFFAERIFNTSINTHCVGNNFQLLPIPLAGSDHYEWTIEGASPSVSTMEKPITQFTTPGEHTITCTIFNSSGSQIAKQTRTVFVEATPTPYFELVQTGPILKFDSIAGIGMAQSWQWNFGDGTTSSLANPKHVYYTSGNYTVSLLIATHCGVATYDQNIQVNVPDNANLTETANDVVIHQDGVFRPGANLKTFPNWTDSQLADIAAGNISKNIKGAGVKSFRTILGENFLDFWGYDIRLDAFQHYNNLDIQDNTITLTTPTFASLDPNQYCPNKQSAIFANLYLDIWDDGNGTPINEDNYFANYVYKTVLVYGDYVKYWEVFNSPDYDESGEKGWLPSGQLGNWWDENPDPCDIALGAPIFYYNRMMRIAYEVIKKYDQDAYVTIPGLAFPSFLDAVLRNTDNPLDGSVAVGYELKGGAYFDAIGIKSFPHFDGSTSHYDGAIGGFAYERHSDAAVKGIVTTKEKFEDVFANHGYGSTFPTKEWIVSEANLPRLPFEEYIGSDVAQSNWIIKAYVTCIKNDIRKLGIFSISERSATPANSIDAMGLYKNLETITPYNQVATNEAIAYKTTTDILFGTVYSPSLTAQLNLPASLDGGVFVDGEGQNILVLWAKTVTDNEEFITEDYTIPSSLFPGTMVEIPWHYSNTGSSTTISDPLVQLLGSPKFFASDLNFLTTPLAHFEADNTTGCLGVSFNLNNQSTANSTTFEWSFPQGTPSTSTLENPSVTYSEAGTYTASLTVTNSAGSHTATFVDYLEVLPKPSADFSFIVTGSDVSFTNLSQDATIYDWTFGDGTGTYHPVHPNYHFNSNGIYEIMLIAKNGCEPDTIIKNIEIAAAPKAAFTPFYQNCTSPYSIHFIDLSFNNPTSWQWTFEGGNPTSSTEASPWVTYEEPGTYSVTFVAINENGNDTITQEILVNGTINEYYNQTLCAGEQLIVHGQIFDEDKPTGQILIASTSGCDTTVSVNLSFAPIFEIDITDSIQMGESVVIGSSIYTASGTYTDVLTSSMGCDSIVHLTLVVLGDPDGLTEAIVTELGYYPNPVQDDLMLTFSLAQNATIEVSVLDLLGREAKAVPISKNLSAGQHTIPVDVRALSRGVYFLRVWDGVQVRALRFIK